MSTPLLDRMRALCRRLADRGWDRLLARHGLDLRAADLERALQAPLTIDLTVPGFEDFAHEGTRAIEPGQPARSLLFHALASPQVSPVEGPCDPSVFPTPVEIETVENFVYASAHVSLEDLRQRHRGAPLAIVVFAHEYRPAVNTVHMRHADMVYARTGIARVGSAAAQYVAAARGYTPFHDDAHQIRVLPCRYAPYIAVQLPANEEQFGPLRFQRRTVITKDFSGRIATVELRGDDTRTFWVPLHKLFSGPECLRGLDLTVSLRATHVNDKLRRVHLALGGQGYPTGWAKPEIDLPPFKFEEGIATLSTDPGDGVGLLVPVSHDPLVERAQMPTGEVITFRVPENVPYASSFNPAFRPSGARSGPEYVHARHRLEDDGSVTNLNTLPKVRDLVATGGYRAVQYVDYVGDGWIEADCPEVALQLSRRFAAYSVVAPIDFLPRVKQQELMHWWTQSSPPSLASKVWPENPGPPLALSDMRFPVNVQLTDAGFDIGDDTMTAIVASPCDGRASTRIVAQAQFRAVALPDGAAGVFAPGWDSSLDRTEETDPTDEKLLVHPGVYHLAVHGLGSPFPEDAKLCAALSAFWPAATPDITRTFPPGRYATATPLTDDVIGVGGHPGWDGTLGPKMDKAHNEIEYASLDYADWVDATFQRQFRFDVIGDMGPEEYAARTLVTASVYAGLGARTTADKRRWAIYSFTRLHRSDPLWTEAAREAKRSLSPAFTYRYEVFEPTGAPRPSADSRTVRVSYDEMITVVADPQTVLFRRKTGPWKIGTLES